jgi:hypothetical protein
MLVLFHELCSTTDITSHIPLSGNPLTHSLLTCERPMNRLHWSTAVKHDTGQETAQTHTPIACSVTTDWLTDCVETRYDVLLFVHSPLHLTRTTVARLLRLSGGAITVISRTHVEIRTLPQQNDVLSWILADWVDWCRDRMSDLHSGCAWFETRTGTDYPDVFHGFPPDKCRISNLK